MIAAGSVLRDEHDRLEERRRYALLHCAALLRRVEPLLRRQWEMSTRVRLVLPPGWEQEAARAQDELRVTLARCEVVLAEIDGVSR